MVSLNFYLSLGPFNCRISWQRKSTARKKNMFPPYLIKTQLTRWMASTESKLSLNGSTHKREISPPPFSQFLTHCVCVSAWVRECLSGWVWVRVWVRVSVTEKERENHFVLTVDRRNVGPRPNAKSNIWTCVCVRKKCVFDNQESWLRAKLLPAGISTVNEFDWRTMSKLFNV